MKKENVITVIALTLAFVTGFKSIMLFLQYSFRGAIVLLILSFSCAGTVSYTHLTLPTKRIV